MKKIILLLMIIGFFSACNNAKDKNASTKSQAGIRAKDDYLNNNKISENKDNTDTKKGWGDKGKMQSWSAGDKEKFMSECEESAAKNVSAARANQYCDCMLQKFITTYPSYNELNLDQSSNAKARMEKFIGECNQQ